MIKVSRLFYDYPNLRALNDVSFELPAQSITALVGPNGAGKTTLLRSMAALDEPLSGQILINGIDVQEHPQKVHTHMGYLPDHFGLYKDLTAHQCLTYAAWARGLYRTEAKEAVEQAIEQVNLKDQLYQQAASLSRGQRQRLALAQAIVHRPKVVLMDEPASGLDPEARASLAELMKQLAAQGMTLLISSHILAELETYCTGMLVINKGKVLTYRALDDVSDDAHAEHGVEGENRSPQQNLGIKKAFKINCLELNEDLLEQLCAWFRGKDLIIKSKSIDQVVIEGRFKTPLEQAALLKELVQQGWKVSAFTPYTQSMQDVYMQMVSGSNAHSGMASMSNKKVKR